MKARLGQLGGGQKVLRMAVVILTMTLCSCGYHIGGLKPAELQNVHTMSVEVFANNTLEPRAGAMVSSAVAEEIQIEGTYGLVKSTKADVRIEGEVRSISFLQLRSSYTDTYESMEVGLRLVVDYRIVESGTNRVLRSSSATAVSSLFNMGNQQSARTNALSYAARLVARDICSSVSNG